MRITKYGHSCILLDDGTTKILFDPGVYSEVPNISVDAIIITHVHADHCEIERIHKLIQSNTALKIITNTEVAAELAQHDLTPEIVEDGQSLRVGTMTIAAYGKEHAVMHPDLPKFQNTGYVINDTIFHPGDALLIPPQNIEFLLLPIAAPWSKISETLDYITAIKAKLNFPIHDGFLDGGGAFYRFANMWCEKNDLQFIELELNKPYDI